MFDPQVQWAIQTADFQHLYLTAVAGGSGWDERGKEIASRIDEIFTEFSGGFYFAECSMFNDEVWGLSRLIGEPDDLDEKKAYVQRYLTSSPGEPIV